MAKPARNANQEQLTFPKAPAKKAGRTPEEIAEAAVARMETTVSGHRIKMTPTLFVTREVALYIVARAIREGKNTRGMIADILQAESRRKSG